MTPTYYLLLSALLFSVGAVGVLVRRNAIVVFMCVELMLNAVNLTLVTFARVNGALDGQVMAFFVMVVAAAEVVVGLAIITSIFRTRRYRLGGRLEPAQILGALPVLSSPTDLLAAVNVPAVPQATGVGGLAWLLFVLPASGALVLFVLGRKANAWGHLLGCLTLVGSFVVGLLIFLHPRLRRQGRAGGVVHAQADRCAHCRAHHRAAAFRWIPANALQVDFGFRLDPLSLTFVLLITGVGSLIHIYSIGYMAPHDHAGGAGTSDSSRRRFFAQLNLFVAAMLLLVLGNNFVLLYLGWEGVGLASYLLIGFYQDRPSAATRPRRPSR